MFATLKAIGKGVNYLSKVVAEMQPPVDPNYVFCQDCGQNYYQNIPQEVICHSSHQMINCTVCYQSYDCLDAKSSIKHTSETRCNVCRQVYDNRDAKISAEHKAEKCCGVCRDIYDSRIKSEVIKHQNEIQCIYCYQIYDQRNQAQLNKHMNENRCLTCNQVYNYGDQESRESHRHSQNNLISSVSKMGVSPPAVVPSAPPAVAPPAPPAVASPAPPVPPASDVTPSLNMSEMNQKTEADYQQMWVRIAHMSKYRPVSSHHHHNNRGRNNVYYPKRRWEKNSPSASPPKYPGSQLGQNDNILKSHIYDFTFGQTPLTFKLNQVKGGVQTACTIMVGLSCTVLELKNQLVHHVGLPAKWMRFLHKGKELKNDEVFFDVTPHITNETVIYMVFADKEKMGG